MAAIIAQLLAMFGPLLSELLKKWLESLLNKTAKALPKNATKADLLNAAYTATKGMPVRRKILRFMIAHQNETKLNPALKNEFKVEAGT